MGGLIFFFNALWMILSPREKPLVNWWLLFICGCLNVLLLIGFTMMAKERLDQKPPEFRPVREQLYYKKE